MVRHSRPLARFSARCTAPLAALGLLALATAAAAQEEVDDCRESGWGRGAAHCEVHELTLRSTGSLAVNARPNGGIRVTGWDGGEVQVRAVVRAHARSEAEARELAGRVRILAEPGSVGSEGPRTAEREGWSVSYEIRVPRRTNLELESVNGGLRVAGVHGRLELSTTNGGIRLQDVGGSVRGATTNGALQVELSGSQWSGDGLELRTRNGSISLALPAGYSARLNARTVNGALSTEIPVTVQGRVDRTLEAELGGGGAPISLRTTNGSIRIRRS